MIENPILVYIIVFISQLLLTTIRIIDIKSTYDNQIHFSALIGMVGAFIWFISTTLGISRVVLHGDLYMVAIFVISAGIGRYFGFYFDKKLNDKKLTKKGIFHTFLFRRF